MSTTEITPAWYRTITAQQWKALWAAALGWMLDAMDFVLYLMAIPTLMVALDFNKRAAGILATVTLLASAIGGVLFGVLADKIGRTRALMATILIYSLCSLGTATAQDYVQLLLWRTVLGLGMGGEWACAAVLVSETWPAQHRGKAISIMQSGWAIGYILAALLTALVLETLQLSWHWLFVIGALPALLVFWVRREVHEPDLWRQVDQTGATAGGPAPVTRVANPLAAILRPPLLGRTLLAVLLSSVVMFAYWGLFTWIPQFLQDKQSGAGLSLWQAAGQIVPLQLGAFLGYLSFGFLADRFGRRVTFGVFLLGAAALVPVYAALAGQPVLLLVVAPLLGYFGHGYFSIFGSLLAELFPTAVRGTGQGFTYNAGRAFAAAAPVTIGQLAEYGGIAWALGFTAIFFTVASVLIVFLPDRSGQQLEA